MPGLDDRIRRAASQMADEVPARDDVEPILRRGRHLRIARRVQAVALAVVVIAGTATGGWALSRAFRSGAGPAASPSVPIAPRTAGDLIAFMSDRDGNDEIYTIRTDGTGLRRLTDDPATDRSPSWSPDGQRIAFVSDRSGYPEVWVMDSDGRDPTRLTYDNAIVSSPAWSPDGSEIAYISNVSVDGHSNHTLWIMGADGRGARRVTSDRMALDHDSSISWSPDGSIAFVVLTSDPQICPPSLGCPPARPTPTLVVLAPYNGGIKFVLTAEAAGDLHDAAFTPDGQSIAFVQPFACPPTAICTIPDGRPTIFLTSHGEIEPFGPTAAAHLTFGADHPAWAGDGRLAFESGGDISTVAPDASLLDLTPGEGRDTQPAWQPGPPVEPTPTEIAASATPTTLYTGCPGQSPFPSPVTQPPTCPTPAATPSVKSSPPSRYPQPECEATSVGGDFEGDGTPDDTAIVVKTACVGDGLPEGSAEWTLDMAWGASTTGLVGLPDCQEGCRALGAVDLNGDGIDELAIVTHRGASTEFLEFYELPASEAFGQHAATVVGDAGGAFASGQSAEFPLSGSVTHLGFLSCPEDEIGRTVVASEAALSEDSRTWTIREVVLLFGPTEDRLSGQFKVVSTRVDSEPASEDGAYPTVPGPPCFPFEFPGP
jgi:hypothetical protein